MPKPELEFFRVDTLPWAPIPGAPPGHFEKILTQDPDKMFVTRLLKVDPGCASTATFVRHSSEPTRILAEAKRPPTITASSARITGTSNR